MIKPETIQAILDTANIEEVVGDFVSLKKRGANLIGLCPFHNEKTPSFTVSPAKGIYKCFGCGKAGNAVHFIMEHEHYSYYDALKYLAAKYKIPVIETERTPEEIQLDNDKDRLFNINAFVHTALTASTHSSTIATKTDTKMISSPNQDLQWSTMTERCSTDSEVV